MPNGGNRTGAARYTVYYTDANNPTVTWTRTIVVDQYHLKDAENPNGAQKRISLGRYYFRQGVHENGLVKLEDAAYIGPCSEASTATQILFDAVQWQY